MRNRSPSALRTRSGHPNAEEDDTGLQPADDGAEETPTEEVAPTPTEVVEETPTEAPTAVPTPTPAEFPVPPVQGQSVEQAQATLRGAGLQVGLPVLEQNDEFPDGTVIRVEPAEGTPVFEGDAVTIVVSTGPDPDLLPCPEDGSRCIQFIDATRDGDLLTINWEATFEPVSTAGQFHAHFFWDIYEPQQAGNNAADFGFSPGSWDAVATQPYVKDLSLAPEGATKFCATVGTPGHGVDNPDLFQCVAIPEG